MVSKTFPKCVKTRKNPKYLLVYYVIIIRRKVDMKAHLLAKRHTLKVVSIRKYKTRKKCVFLSIL